jgi:hypothetical protein
MMQAIYKYICSVRKPRKAHQHCRNGFANRESSVSTEKWVARMAKCPTKVIRSFRKWRTDVFDVKEGFANRERFSCVQIKVSPLANSMFE